MDPAGPLKLDGTTSINSTIARAVNDHADRIAALEIEKNDDWVNIRECSPRPGMVLVFTTECLTTQAYWSGDSFYEPWDDEYPASKQPMWWRPLPGQPPQPEAQDELTPYGEALQEAERLRKENKALSEELTHLKKSMVATYQATRRPDDTDFVIAHLDKLREENWAEIKKLRKENEELTEAVKAECDNRDEMHDKIERLEKQLKEAIHKGDVSGMFCDSLRMERNNLREDKENLRERLQQYEECRRRFGQIMSKLDEEDYVVPKADLQWCLAPIEEKSDE